MSAEPAHYSSPDDPVEILRVLPLEYHARFLAEYQNAISQARRPEEFRQLAALLRLWRLRAAAYTDPGYPDRLDTARRGEPADFTPASQVIPRWPGR